MPTVTYRALLQHFFRSYWVEFLLFSWFALLVRVIYPLGEWRLTFDEIYSIHIAGESVRALLHFSLIENSPPLFYFVLKGWIAVFGSSSLALRVFPLLGTALAMIAAFFLQNHLWRSAVSRRITLLLMTLSPLLVFFGRELRMYTLIIFFGLGTFYYSWKYIDTKRTKYLICSLCGFFITGMTHFGTWLPLFAHFIFVLVAAPWYSLSRLRWFFWHCIPSVLLLAYAAISFSVRHDMGINPFDHWSFTITEYDQFLPGVLQAGFFSNIGTIWLPNLVYVAFFCVASFLFFFTRTDGKNRDTSSSLRSLFDRRLWVLFVLLAPLGIGCLLHQNSLRFYVLSLAMLFLFFGHVFSEMRPNIIRLALLCILLGYSIVLLIIFIPSFKPTDWQGLVTYVEERASPEDLVLVHVFNEQITFDWYKTREDIHVQGFLPEKPDYTFEDVAVYNPFQNVNETNIEKLQEFTEEYDKVFLVIGTGDEDGSFWGGYRLLSWFNRNDWEELEAKTFSNYDGLGTVHTYVRKSE